MKTIRIGRPKIEANNNRIRWSCAISGDFLNMSLYYETETKWGKYLTDDRLDVALVALIPYAMYRSKSDDRVKLICEAPVSEKLKFQLTQELMPALEKECDWYTMFDLECDALKNTYNGNAVSTSVSCGVDSFYTLIKSKREFPREYKVTHGLFCGMADREVYNDLEYKNAKDVCEKLGIDFVYVESNVVGGVYESRHDAVSSFVIPSVALVLGKLFKVYYHSSSHVYSEFKLDQHGISMADPVLLSNFSTETLQMYTCSGAVTRAEKTDYISDDEVVQNHLLVCSLTAQNDFGGIRNCSKCSKCTITMIDLDLAGRLDKFGRVFDIEPYRKKPLYYWGYVFYKEKHGLYIDSTLEMAAKKHYKIPVGSRLSGLIKIIKHGFRRTNPYQNSFRP